jgi:hypothetical protein
MPKRPSKKPKPEASSTLAAAEFLRLPVVGGSGFRIMDEPYVDPNGIIEPNARFRIIDSAGRSFGVIVVRDH